MGVRTVLTAVVCRCPLGVSEEILINPYHQNINICTITVSCGVTISSKVLLCHFKALYAEETQNSIINVVGFEVALSASVIQKLSPKYSESTYKEICTVFLLRSAIQRWRRPAAVLGTL